MAGKFDDIKVGDVVYVPETITLGWGTHLGTFFVRRKVIKVSPKQFRVEGLPRSNHKRDGSPVGSGSPVFNLGDERRYGSVIVTDQTEEYNLAKNKVKIINDLGHALHRSDIRKYIDQITDIELECMATILGKIEETKNG